ncbi:MAG TPA: hypothetical protein VI488_18180 [Candidatus Angelobacter sp.]
MSVRINKAWMPLTLESVKRLKGHLGVYQIQDTSGQLIFIGYAGGRSLFGLRGELERELASRGPGHNFRYEVSMQYMTRYKELLMVHAADHGELPADNRKFPPPRLGRMRPV